MTTLCMSEDFARSNVSLSSEDWDRSTELEGVTLSYSEGRTHKHSLSAREGGEVPSTPPQNSVAFPADAQPDTPRRREVHAREGEPKRTLSELLRLYAEKGTEPHCSPEEAASVGRVLGQWVSTCQHTTHHFSLTCMRFLFACRSTLVPRRMRAKMTSLHEQRRMTRRSAHVICPRPNFVRADKAKASYLRARHSPWLPAHDTRTHASHRIPCTLFMTADPIEHLSMLSVVQLLSSLFPFLCYDLVTTLTIFCCILLVAYFCIFMSIALVLRGVQ